MGLQRAGCWSLMCNRSDKLVKWDLGELRGEQGRGMG